MGKKSLRTALPLAVICCTARMLPAQATVSTLASFNITNGSDPYAGLVADLSGNFYGTTGFGGSSSDGVIFELSGSNHQTLTTLLNFNGSNGAKPFGALVKDSGGNFYGTTETGGANNLGSVFEMPAGNPSAVITLLSFNNSTGTSPFAGLALDANGNLYGTTAAGGVNQGGTVFELSGASHQNFSLLTNLNSSTGSSSQAGLVIDRSGNIYGTTTSGGSGGSGTIFELSGRTHSNLTNLASFNGSNGGFPVATLTIGPDGNLYGTTAQGGSANDGTVFRLSGTSYQTLTTLATFTGTNGTTPYSTLIFDAAGNLFGTTQNGGPSSGGNNGTVFELSGTNYQALTQIFGFTGSLSTPRGALYNDASGTLYGTTLVGGASQAGAVYQLSNSGFIAYLPALNVSTGTTQIAPPTTPGITLTAYEALIISPNTALIFAASTGVTGSRRNIKERSLNLSNGILNLNNNDMSFSNGDSLGDGSSNSGSGTIVYNGNSNTSNLAAATAAVATGYNNGKWNGATGIVSNTAADDTTHMTAIGVIQNNQSGTAIYTSSNLFDNTVEEPDAILFKYTYYGDANLDGKVDGSDYSLIDTGYLSHGALTGWFNGDFNYDGAIDGSDYTMIDNVFNRQGSAITASINASSTSQIATVPEPALPALLAIMALGLKRRRTPFSS